MNSKSLVSLFLGGFWLITPAVWAAQNAQVQMANNSIRMNPGNCDCGLGLEFNLYFSSFFTEEVYQANGELLPLAQPASASHWSWIILEDVSLSTAVTWIKLNLPLAADFNGDGLADFLDVSQGISTATSGTYADIWSVGQENPVTAVWSRTPGARLGTCNITLRDPMLGDLGPFRHTFEVIHYTGTLAYTPGTTTVSGTMSVSQTGNPGSQIQGPVQFVKSTTNPHNVLSLQNGTWNRTDSGPLAFTGGTFTRSATTYDGSALATDGYYRSWTLAITDPHDANGNGIPDFSDTPMVSPPRPPRLSLSLVAGNLRLSIAGDVNRVHRIQEALSPAATEWTTIQSVTLTSDPQAVTLPVPTGAPKYWRVKAE